MPLYLKVDNVENSEGIDNFIKKIKKEVKNKENNFGQEMNLYKRLKTMCYGFEYDDYIKSRSTRDWESFNKLTGAEKVIVRIQEVQQYKSE